MFDDKRDRGRCETADETGEPEGVNPYSGRRWDEGCLDLVQRARGLCRVNELGIDGETVELPRDLFEDCEHGIVRTGLEELVRLDIECC